MPGFHQLKLLFWGHVPVSNGKVKEWFNPFWERIYRNGLSKLKKFWWQLPQGFTGVSWKMLLPSLSSDKKKTVGGKQRMHWMKQEIWKQNHVNLSLRNVIMCIYMGTELRLHRYLWPFQTLQCLIFCISITYYCFILHLVQCTLREERNNKFKHSFWVY